MGKIIDFFKSQQGQKWSVLGLLVIILIAIPLTISQLSNLSTTQTINQHANNTHTGGAQDFPCGSVTIKVFANEQINNSTNPNQCSSGTVSNLDSYKSDFSIALENGSSGDYKVKWAISRNFCDSAKSPCIDIQSNISGGPTALPVSASTGWETPNIGSACGFYQNDVSFQIFNSSGSMVCQWGDMNNPATGNYCNSQGTCLANAYWATCNSGKTCTPVTPPTATPTMPTPPTATPTIPVDTPTDTPIPSDTPTPGLTVTPTDTPSPTPTGTVTPAPTDTPTPTTPPNQPTNTPAPTVIVAQPTLPPTGPGNTLLTIGAVGVIIAVAGVFLAIGL